MNSIYYILGFFGYVYISVRQVSVMLINNRSQTPDSEQILSQLFGILAQESRVFRIFS
ncbi:MAG: hypothetical protein V7L14_06815 [Nostoc sp.]|uniref:hypothetical protein n=1 Tax=Nostoc sp. TaxID=1180 RepID=UPI002FFCE15E